MTTISPEQFFKNGSPEKATVVQPTPSKVPTGSFLDSGLVKAAATPGQNIIDAAKSGINQTVEGFKQTQEGAQMGKTDIVGGATKIGRGILNQASGVISTIFSPISGLFKTAAGAPLPGDQTVGSVMNKAVQEIVDASKISTVPALQEFARNNPNAEEVIGNLINIIGTVAGGKAAPEIKTAVTEVVPNVLKKPVELPTPKVADVPTPPVVETPPIAPKTPSSPSPLTDATGKITDTITSIDKGVETVLDPTKVIPKENLKNIPQEKIIAQAETKSDKLNMYVKKAEQAVTDYSKPTPLAIAGQKADDALTILNNKLAKQGELKREALGTVGDKTVGNVDKVKTSLEQTLSDRIGIRIEKSGGELSPEQQAIYDALPPEQKAIADMFDAGKPKYSITNAPGRISKVSLDPADNAMLSKVFGFIDGLGNKPTVRMIDDAVDAIQDVLYKRKQNVAEPVNGLVEGALKEFTGRLNNAVKKVAGEQYTKANSKFAYFVQVRDKLNQALGKEGVRGAALMKQLFSPSGEAPRRLFAKIKDLTGIDLVEEATLAKFVMENIGDARQSSLLEEVIKGRAVSPKSFIGAAADKVINALQDPVGKAQRIIENSKTKGKK